MIEVLYKLYIERLKRGEEFNPILYVKKDDKIIMNFIPCDSSQEKKMFRDKLYEKTQKENIIQCCAVMISTAVHTLTKEKKYSFLLVECSRDGNNKSIIQFYEYDKNNKIKLLDFVTSDDFKSYWDIFKIPETMHDCEN